ncbi:MAG TPA: VWA domain-containing protein [Candidatus Acidoferrum sp.]|jgi:Ca-activated chloride channel homolog|nr:VWA domain-containing protein [Candidatus Acidoferrum sp.]
MSRALISLFLVGVLLTAAVSDRAQQAPAKPATLAQSSPTPQATPPAAPQQGQQEEKSATPQTPQKIIQVVNLVDVLFTVLNRRNKLVPDLQKEDFQIFDEKFPQDIRYFSKQSDLPLRIGMLVDTSNSIRDRIKFEQDASINFLFSVLRRGRDEAFVMTFDDEPQVVQAFTSDAGLLRDQIMQTRAGGGTAIYDAIYQACQNELSHPPRPPGDQPDVVRRVMILISDGDDNLSTHTRGEAIEMAQRTSVVIYTISTSTQWIQLSQTDPDKLANRKTHLTEGDKILQDLADETGGRAFFPYHVDDLDQSFQDIGDELRNQYSIAYIPTNYVLDGRYHRIRIEVPDHKGYQVRARRGYFARANRENNNSQPSPSGPASP